MSSRPEAKPKWRDLLVSHRGTDILVEKRIPPLRCASVGMTTPFGQEHLACRIGRYSLGTIFRSVIVALSEVKEKELHSALSTIDSTGKIQGFFPFGFAQGQNDGLKPAMSGENCSNR